MYLILLNFNFSVFFAFIIGGCLLFYIAIQLILLLFLYLNKFNHNEINKNK